MNSTARKAMRTHAGTLEVVRQVVETARDRKNRLARERRAAAKV